MKKFTQIFQFKINLKDINPPIWRVIQVPETYTFWDLHVAIQDAMGWSDSHLHSFKIKNSNTGEDAEIGMPDEDLEDSDIYLLPDWEQKIHKWFTEGNTHAEYVYDFGDNWRHDIVLENIIAREKGLKYPRCVYGERACPPEDCGSVSGYERMLKIIKDKKHEEYKDMIRWLGGKYDPEHFDIKEVHFDDPKERFKKAFEAVE